MTLFFQILNFYLRFFCFSKTIQQRTPPRTAGLLIRKTLTGVLWEGSHTWKSRVPGFQKIFTAEFGHFLVTIFFYKFFSKKIIKKKQVTKKWPNSAVKKIPGTGISNPGTGKKSWVPGFQIPVPEIVYIIEKIFRALRAHPKPLPAS